MPSICWKSVVGSMTISGAAHAFLYSGGTMIDLNSFISPRPSEWTLAYAKGINDSGEITGYGEILRRVADPSVPPVPALPGDARIWTRRHHDAHHRAGPTTA